MVVRTYLSSGPIPYLCTDHYGYGRQDLYLISALTIMAMVVRTYTLSLQRPLWIWSSGPTCRQDLPYLCIDLYGYGRQDLPPC